MARPAYVWSGTEWVPVGPVTPTSPFHYQATPPSSPANGDVWVDSDGDLDALVLNAGDFATQSDLTSGLAPKADLAGPTFSGTVNLPATTNYDGTQLSTTFASKLPYTFGTATPTTTDSGFLWYDSNSTPAAPKFWDGAAFQALTSGKILQIVRATDSTARTTTSGSFVDANISVTISPQKNDSAVILIWSFWGAVNTNNNFLDLQITDNSNNPISGAGTVALGSTNGGAFLQSPLQLIGYSTPATTSATTYKGRFRSNLGGTVELRNNISAGQLYAIEVSA